VGNRYYKASAENRPPGTTMPWLEAGGTDITYGLESKIRYLAKEGQYSTVAIFSTTGTAK